MAVYLNRDEVAGPITPEECAGETCLFGGYQLGGADDGYTYSGQVSISDKGDLIAVGAPSYNGEAGGVWLYKLAV